MANPSEPPQIPVGSSRVCNSNDSGSQSAGIRVSPAQRPSFMTRCPIFAGRWVADRDDRRYPFDDLCRTDFNAHRALPKARRDIGGRILVSEDHTSQHHHAAGTVAADFSGWMHNLQFQKVAPNHVDDTCALPDLVLSGPGRRSRGPKTCESLRSCFSDAPRRSGYASAR